MEQSTQPLVCPSHKAHYVTAVLVGIVIGGGLAFAYGANNYQKGFDAAKKLVAESPAGAIFVSPSEVTAVSGVVTAVNGNSVTIHMQSTNPFDDQNLLDRTITIPSGVKVTKIVMPDPKEMQAQMDAFMKATQAGKTPTAPIAPIQPKETTIEVSAIKVGDTVTATAGENIKTMKSFTATEVRVQ